MKNFYNILNVTAEATFKEIKKSYRKLAMKYHPDKNPGNQVAEEKFKEISEAYKILGSEKSRTEYDRDLKRGGDGRFRGQKSRGSNSQKNYRDQGFDINDFEDNFKDFFGFDPKTKQKINKNEKAAKPTKDNKMFNQFFNFNK
ncbi:MAG: DnaJ domain-containing protein [Fusobacteriota bacterium]